jgi:3-hydroxy acid dehydrogenase / malonic semialdehyde reductase
MKTYLVTGASSGIGLATSQRLIEAGHHVIGLARDFSSTPALGELFFPYAVDLAKIEDIPTWIPSLAPLLSNLSGIILCAGQGRFGSLETFSWDQINYLIQLNLTSPLLLIKALAPYLKQQSHSDIILIGSEAALAGSKQGTVYCASKFGLRGAAQSLRKEYANQHIRVSLINPGAVDTDFFDTLHFAPESKPDYTLAAEDIAESILYVLGLPPSSVVEELNIQPLKRAFKSKAGKTI